MIRSILTSSSVSRSLLRQMPSRVSMAPVSAAAALRARMLATLATPSPAGSNSSNSKGNRRLLLSLVSVFCAATVVAAAAFAADADGFDFNGAPVALNKKDFVTFPLRESRELTHNTRLLRFDLPSDKHVLGLPVASCVVVKTVNDAVMRPYTPTTDVDQLGYFDLIVKRYPGGAMSEHLFKLKPGDQIEVKGPIPKYMYKPNEKKEIGMVAGGTGITPMYQIIREIIRNPSDHTKVSLVYGNVTEDDIILRKELDALAAAFPEKVQIFYVLDKASENWKGGRGYFTEEMLRSRLPSPNSNTAILVCGPEGMMKHVSGPKGKNYTQGELNGILKSLGYTQEEVFKF